MLFLAISAFKCLSDSSFLFSSLTGGGGSHPMMRSRDGNLDPTHGYPARPDPNGPDFTQLDKE